MPTWTALTTLRERDSAEALGEALEEIDLAPVGVGVFEMEDGSGLWEVGAYFTEAPDEIALALLAAAYGAQPFAVSLLPETDWVAHVRRELHPVEAGRFFLYGSHDADKVPEGCVPLLIEAAMAFGTGHHGTTKGCLEAYDLVLAEGMVPQRVADIGAGTAVLAIAAALTSPNPVLASDIDPVAVEVAEANAAANGVSGRVRCIEAAGFDHPEIAAGAPYDLIFANILKGPLLDLAAPMKAHVAPGGRIILSGILNEQADEVIAAYAGEGLRCLRRAEIGEWTTLTIST
ncbi:50S ribosomal protein L11 methyltransferase [Roseibacterium sp. SDUM158017]|uniref:50S ribosomal protein L11 methyltransferase n=1 Tax=Roseicyclus salinarum TaxID=3036773 RepID=UPI0024158B22|nr:50S ribosomal protein L11 methyltransferase [Roseibacterium sp. SDUM158017]MDG4648211.1 50S ribosomal protein L11 methyltransferase [Roseibacterium sp. SDUM158017]